MRLLPAFVAGSLSAAERPWTQMEKRLSFKEYSHFFEVGLGRVKGVS